MRYRLLYLIIFIVTACSFPRAKPNAEIQQAVAATLAAMPTAPAPPISSPFPSPTPFNLAGLFCEYQFCVGHPIDMAFYDVSAQQNLGTPSSYTQGLIAAFNASLFIQMVWQLAPGAADPQFMLDLILDPGLDTRVGTLEVKLVRDMNIVYTPITSTATPLLPFGGAAAWICGDRAFAWKVYTPDEQSAPTVFENSFNRFICTR
ncbi:MAG: hypothetical protein L0287_29380 [Anaerolineae bacterium]|nr:hypothetical protein [Anaerolineae bacterium]MCI0611195.1 hypothetical protein [Anaerolineae bacterium]